MKIHFIRSIEEVVGSFYGLEWNEFVLLHKTTKRSEKERKIKKKYIRIIGCWGKNLHDISIILLRIYKIREREANNGRLSFFSCKDNTLKV